MPAGGEASTLACVPYNVGGFRAPHTINLNIERTSAPGAINLNSQTLDNTQAVIPLVVHLRGAGGA